MSQSPGRPPSQPADIHGQLGEQQLALAGWIGEHPLDGGDVAHLLVHPHGHGVADKMRTLAGILGLGLGTVLEVPPDTTWVQLDEPAGWARIHHGDAAWIARPVTDEWLTVARTRHMVVLSLILDAGDVRAAGLDRYIATAARRGRLYLGLVRAD